MRSLRRKLQPARPPWAWTRARLPQLALTPVVLFGVLFSLLLGSILAVPLSSAALITKGQPSPTDVQATQDLTYVSEVEMRAAQLRISNDPSLLVYHTDPQILQDQRTALVAALDAIAGIKDNPTTDEASMLAALTRLPSVPLTATQASAIIGLSAQGWQRVADETRKLFDQKLRASGDALTPADIADLRARVLPYQPKPADFSAAQQDLMIFLTGAFLQPNRTVDEAATERRRAAALAQVGSITKTIANGQMVVRRGDIVSDATFEALTKLGVVRGIGGWVATAQQFLLGVLVASVFTFYLASCQRRVTANWRALAVIGAMLSVVVLAGQLLLPLWSSAPFVFPFATVGVLLAVIFNGELALVATLMFTPLLGLQSPATLGLSLTLALGGAAGIFVAQRAQRTSTFAWSGVAVALLTLLAALVFWLDLQARLVWEWSTMGSNPLLGIIFFSLLNGALSAVLALGSSHFLSRAAHVVTPLQLMELSHPNHPLLSRLMREAPGTYHHSMVVSNLAEVAAERIGADPLLTRVGAYYHDVGKLLRPYFFTDNQHDRANVHDQLDAKTSASIIIDHVREGAKLAAEHKLPQQIIDFIPQHHGTNVVSYFYQRALQEDVDADPAAFSYPGPRPQSREAAILMLADGVEATIRAKSQAGRLAPARASDDASPRVGDTIADTVEMIVGERIASHQLDESPLTMHDIAAIKDSFTRTLQGIYHPRVDYAKQRAPKNS